MSATSVSGTPPPSPQSETGRQIHSHLKSLPVNSEAANCDRLVSQFPGVIGNTNDKAVNLIQELTKTTTLPMLTLNLKKIWNSKTEHSLMKKHGF